LPLWDFNGYEQTVSLKLYNNGMGAYIRPIVLNKPTFSKSMVIFYSPGELKSMDKNTTETDFIAETGFVGATLSGTMYFTYSDTPPEKPTITTTSLPNGTVGTAYNQTLTATGDTPITWSIVKDSLPAGLTISTGGTIFGTPSAVGTYKFTVKASNLFGDDTKELSITIGTVGIVETASLPSIQVFPNPTNGQIRITGYPISDMRLSDIKIYDIVGKKQESRISEIGQSEIVLDISHLANGLYFLKVDGKVFKIIKN